MRAGLAPRAGLGLVFLVCALGCFEAGSVRLGAETPGPEGIEGRRLRADELAALDSGMRLSYPSVFWARGGKVISTLSYVTLGGPPESYEATLDEVTSIREWLPFNRSTEVVRKQGDLTVLRIAQGFDEPLQARFSLLVRREGRVLRWELDPSRPHDIRDLWGYVALRPHGEETLMIVAVSVDLGEGILRDVLEKEIHGMMGWAVEDARDYFFSRRRSDCAP